MATERDTKTSFVESKTSSNKMKCGTTVVLWFTVSLPDMTQTALSGKPICARVEVGWRGFELLVGA